MRSNPINLISSSPLPPPPSPPKQEEDAVSVQHNEQVLLLHDYLIKRRDVGDQAWGEHFSKVLVFTITKSDSRREFFLVVLAFATLCQ